MTEQTDRCAAFRAAAWAWLQREGDSALPFDVHESISPAPTTRPSGDVARAHLKALLEALIFASDRPISAKELARASKAHRSIVKPLLDELMAEYQGHGFRLQEIAGGYAFRTSATFAPFVREMSEKRPVRMSRAQLETLAIVAYRQPITRPEIDEVRGVDSGAALKALGERELVRILGKKEEPGRPILYGTSAQFLEFFGLKSLADLPTLREFTELTDESRQSYERELGEEPPAGLMGGEGTMQVDSPDTAPANQQTDTPAATDEPASQEGGTSAGSG